MEQQCIFCAIGNKQIPSYIVYEDEATLAFLDRNPASPGHVIVIPKNHTQTLFDMSIEYYTHLLGIAKKIGEYLIQGLGAEGINILCSVGQQAGQRIPHAFIHVIPRYKEDGIHIAWDMKPSSEEDLAAVQTNILNLMGGSAPKQTPVQESKPLEEKKEEPKVEKKEEPKTPPKPRIPSYW